MRGLPICETQWLGSAAEGWRLLYIQTFAFVHSQLGPLLDSRLCHVPMKWGEKSYTDPCMVALLVGFCRLKITKYVKDLPYI